MNPLGTHGKTFASINGRAMRTRLNHVDIAGKRGRVASLVPLASASGSSLPGYRRCQSESESGTTLAFLVVVMIMLCFWPPAGYGTCKVW